MSKRTKYTKEHDQYWMQRIHSANGINWHCFFQHAGDRRHLSIPPSNQEFTAKSPKQLAAEKAKAIYLSLKVNGWDATLAKLWTNKPGKKINVTIGEYLDAVRLTTNMEARTRTGYESCLNRIVSDVFGYGEGASDRQRYDYKGGGRAEWLAKVHAVRLALLTPEKVQQWKIDFLKSANPDPISQRQKKVSCNTTLRQAKSLFAPDVLANLGNAVELPPVLPFSKIQFEPRQSLKYAGGLDIDKLIAAAGNDLAQSAPEQFKIFLLGCMAGLNAGKLTSWNGRRFYGTPTRSRSKRPNISKPSPMTVMAKSKSIPSSWPSFADSMRAPPASSSSKAIARQCSLAGTVTVASRTSRNSRTGCVPKVLTAISLSTFYGRSSEVRSTPKVAFTPPVPLCAMPTSISPASSTPTNEPESPPDSAICSRRPPMSSK